MPKYRVYASQEIIYFKEVEAESEDEAEELAWEDDGSRWEECHFGDWQLEQGTEEVENV